MGELVDRFGGKLPGQLILSEDWNGLVDAVEGMGDALGARIDALSASVDEAVDDLRGRLDLLEAGHGQLATTVGHLVDHHVPISLETGRTSYATGELAEITARLSDVAGEELQIGAPDTRPWVAFVTVWGRLRPAPNTTALTGAEGRSIAVRVEPDGTARVLLQAELAEGLTTDDEDEFAGALTTRVGSTQLSIAETFLDAATPAEAKSRGAFQLITQHYEQASAPAIRRYTDQYYVQNTASISGTIRPVVTTRWRDHHSTVMAFVQPDADPRTPDASLGSASLHVRFRDWIGPWIVLDYLDTLQTGALVGSFRDRLVPRVTGSFSATITGIRQEVDDLVRTDGLLGRVRDYQVLAGALGTLNVAQAPDFLPLVTATFQQAVTLQQVVEPAQVAVPASAGKAGLDALAGAVVRSAGEVNELRATVDGVATDLRQLDGTVETVRQDVAGLDGKVEVAVSQTIGSLDAKVETVRGQVSTIQQLYPEPVKEKLLDFHTKLLDVADLQRRVGQLER
jgi:hypothetical protein